jgi:hypothetical protein
MLHLENVDGVLNAGHAVEVRVDDHVGNVTVNEHRAGRLSDDFVSGHASVGTADPQDLGSMALEVLEELRVALPHAGGPSLVGIQQGSEILLVPRPGPIEVVVRHRGQVPALQGRHGASRQPAVERREGRFVGSQHGERGCCRVGGVFAQRVGGHECGCGGGGRAERPDKYSSGSHHDE